jgi:putative SOS response-associated peptidase YedK
MAEKKLVIEALRFTYSGMFDVEEFLKQVDKWTGENGYERETKKKSQIVEEDHKKLEYVFELWKKVREDAKVVVRMKALFNNMVDFELERNGFKRAMQKGEVLVIIDGFVETDFEHAWTEKPWFVFLRTLYDKLIWKYWLGRFDGACAAACKGLFNQLHEFFKKHKY